MSANEVLLIVIGIAVGVVIAAAVFFLARPVQPKRPAETKPVVAAPPKEESATPSFLKKFGLKGSYVLRVNTSTHQIIISSHKYQILRTDDRTEFVVDGVKFDRVEDIPDPQMRAEAQRLLPTLPKLTAAEKEALVRAVAKGGMLDADGNIPMPSGDKIVIQKTDGKANFIINGVTYNSLEEIPDPEIRLRVQTLMTTLPLT